jgi:hypothetical protein
MYFKSIEVRKDKVVKDTWRFEAIANDGRCYVVIFTGPFAAERAHEYLEFQQVLGIYGVN